MKFRVSRQRALNSLEALAGCRNFRHSIYAIDKITPKKEYQKEVLALNIYIMYVNQLPTWYRPQPSEYSSALNSSVIYSPSLILPTPITNGRK